MSVIKNSQVSAKYSVSKATVAIWVQKSLENKNNLQLEKIKNKFYIIDNIHNNLELSKLAEQGRKHRGNNLHAEVEPIEKFYKIFNDEQVWEIINQIELKNEIPNKLAFVDTGAIIWNDYYNLNVFNGEYLTPQRVINLLNSSVDYLKYKLKNVESVNIIDIGQGNSHPVKDWIYQIKKFIPIKRYVAIDVSTKMNEISRKNINEWFPEIEFISYTCDVEKTYFDTVFTPLKDELDGKKNINIILYLGSMIGMHEDKLKVLKNFKEGMGKYDLLMVSNTVDSSLNRADFRYVKNPKADSQNTWIPGMLGIDIKNCELVSKFDSITNNRVLNLKLDKDYTIKFKVFEKSKKVFLHKGQEINIWKHEMTNINRLIDDFEKADLQIINAVMEVDLSHVLSISEAKKMA